LNYFTGLKKLDKGISYFGFLAIERKKGGIKVAAGSGRILETAAA
jgi:hypothetical protein